MAITSSSEDIPKLTPNVGAPIFEQILERDDLGRITTKTEIIDGVTTVYEYFYDTAGRLHEVRRGGLTISIYDYDLNSNRGAYTDEFRVITNST